jgi:hypothetical protein
MVHQGSSVSRIPETLWFPGCVGQLGQKKSIPQRRGGAQRNAENTSAFLCRSLWGKVVKLCFFDNFFPRPHFGPPEMQLLHVLCQHRKPKLKADG